MIRKRISSIHFGVQFITFMYILLMSEAPLYSDVLPLTGATGYSSRDPFTSGIAYAFSEDTVFAEQGEINHKSGAAVAFLGIASNVVFDGIRSDVFQVNQSGPYRLRITGLWDVNIIEGNSASLSGASTAGGVLLMGGGLTCVAGVDTVIYETDYSLWAYIQTASWAAIIEVLDFWTGGTLPVSTVFSTIRDLLEPSKNWLNRPFRIDSYSNLESGIDHRWTFWIATVVAADGFGLVNEVATFEADVYNLQVELEYMGNPVHNVHASYGRNGELYPRGTIIVSQGDNQDFIVYPETEYEVKNWYLDGDSIQSGGNNYTLSNIQDNHNIFVNFEPIDNRQISVLAPDSGETWFKGRTEYIAWDFEGNVGDQVNIDLIKGGIYNSPIIHLTNNDGHHPWPIPDTLTEGSDYQVKISSLDNSVSDTSDGYFSIIPPVESDTIPITTALELQMVSTGGAYPDTGYYLLMNNIDLNGFDFEPIGYNVPANYFRGTFNGQGYEISHLEIDWEDSSYLGLFSVIEQGGVVENLTLTDPDIIGDERVGGIAGKNKGSIINCTVAASQSGGGQVRGYNRIGGISGDNQGVIRQCSLTQVNTNNTIEVRADFANVGGIVGENGQGSGSDALVEFCYVDSPDIWGQEDNNGGIAGGNYDRIFECVFKGFLTGRDWGNGGIVGRNYSGGLIKHCNFLGTIDGDTFNGGIVGYFDGGYIEECYAAGSIYANDKGGIAGRWYGTISKCFWDTQVTGCDSAYCDGSGIIINSHGKTTSEMKQETTFTTQHNTNWDFTGVWAIEENNSYPMLRNVGEMLSPPDGLTASLDQSDGIHLSWNHRVYYIPYEVPTPGLIGPLNAVYRVYRSNNQNVNPPEIELTNEWQTSNSFVDTTAIPGANYYYPVKVAATISGARESEFSAFVMGQRTYPPLNRPRGVSASDGIPNSILIEWDVVSNANFYRVFRADSINGAKSELGNWQTELAFSDIPPYFDTLYYYWVKAAVDNSGGRESAFSIPDEGFYTIDTTTDITEKEVLVIPVEFCLYQAYPNPFNSQTLIKYALPEASSITINVFDIMGRKVETLIDARQQAGYHQVIWNAEGFSSGMYIYKLQAGDYIETKKMVVLK